MSALLAERSVYGDGNQYGYTPSSAAGIVFLIAFSILTAAHLAVLVKSRIWWTVVIFIGGLGEALGWVARTWASQNPYSHDAYVWQIVLLIIMPCLFSAAVYGITGHLIRVVGPEFSLLRPERFLWVFCTIDVVSILVQAAGGGMASGGNPSGDDVMVAGIAFQLASMLIYSAIALHFILRAHRRALPGSRAATLLASRPIRTLVWSLSLADVAIIVRGVYRTVELAQGFHGYTISHEVFTLVLDAIPMVFCMAFLLPAHPYFGFKRSGVWAAHTAGGEKEKPILQSGGSGASSQV